MYDDLIVSFSDEEQSDEHSDNNNSEDYSDQSDECEHLNRNIISSEEICTDCGKTLRVIVRRPKKNKKNTNVIRNIEKDLQELNIPEDIKTKANEYYMTIAGSNIHRLSPRKELIVFCIYTACKNYGISVNYRSISSQLGFTVGSMSKIIKKYMNKDIGSKKSSPIDYVSEELMKLSSQYVFPENAKDDIKVLYDLVKNKTKGIVSTGHVCMCSGLIYFYMKDMLQYDIKISKYIELSTSSATTIQRIYTEIRNIINNYNKTHK